MPSVQQFSCRCGSGPPTMRTGWGRACGSAGGRRWHVDGTGAGQAEGHRLAAEGTPARRSGGCGRGPAVQADAVASAVEIPEPQGGLAWILAIAQVVPVIVMLIACGDAAILVLARTATRWNGVAVRTVLGASRARIIGQHFVGTLLLSLVATGIGLIAIDVAVAPLAARFPLPFSLDPNITPAFALKALGLSVLCAVVAGVLPALRAPAASCSRRRVGRAGGAPSASDGWRAP